VSFDSQEQQASGAQPYELYLFQGTGIFFALTSADEPITYLGNTYLPSTITRSESEQSNEVVSGQMKVYLPETHPLSALLLPYLPTSPIAVTVYGSHYGDSQTVVLFTGTVASARYTDQCEMTCNSSQYLLQRKIPRQLYQSPCGHIFGDAGCGIELAAHTYTGEVATIDPTGTILTVTGFASLPDSLTAGFLRFGNFVRMIVANSGDSVTLLSPIAGLQVGSSVLGTAGCQLTFAACQAYKNSFNFLGFDLIPEINPFDGSASVG
jgi:uncharacterized phage protein (TIGR02218 family)